MEPITNDYGFIHGGYLFYLLDKSSQDYAIKSLGDCLTGNVNIYYHKPVLPTDVDDIKIYHKKIYKTNSTILIEAQLKIKNELYVTAFFTFIKIKK